MHDVVNHGCDHAADDHASCEHCKSYHFVFLLSSRFVFIYLSLHTRYIAVAPRATDAIPITANAAIIFFFSFFDMFVFIWQ